MLNRDILRAGDRPVPDGDRDGTISCLEPRHLRCRRRRVLLSRLEILQTAASQPGRGVSTARDQSRHGGTRWRSSLAPDEAGYGPDLGPLVVTATVWEVPDRLTHSQLYAALQHALTPSIGWRVDRPTSGSRPPLDPPRRSCFPSLRR